MVSRKESDTYCLNPKNRSKYVKGKEGKFGRTGTLLTPHEGNVCDRFEKMEDDNDK